MNSFRDLSIYFNTELMNKEFQLFINEKLDDLTEYNIAESDYIKSKKYGIELGFKNIDAVCDEDDKVIIQEGNPFFSHFNLYSESVRLFDCLPFGINFGDKRNSVINKVGKPNQTNKGDIPILGHYLIDFYFIDDLRVSIDYKEDETIKFIQVKIKD